MRETGLTQDALLQYKDLEESFPEACPAKYELARSYQMLGETAQAFTYIERAISCNSTDITYPLFAAQLYEKQGNLLKAKQTFQFVLQMDPTNAIAVQAIRRISEGN